MIGLFYNKKGIFEEILIFRECFKNFGKIFRQISVRFVGREVCGLFYNKKGIFEEILIFRECFKKILERYLGKFL